MPQAQWDFPVSLIAVPNSVQQAQYDLAQVRPDRIKLKRLEPA